MTLPKRWYTIQRLLDKERYSDVPEQFQHLIPIAKQMVLLQAEMDLLQQFMDLIYEDEVKNVGLEGGTERRQAYEMLHGCKARCKQLYHELRLQRWTRWLP